MKNWLFAIIAFASLGSEAATGCLFVGQGDAQIRSKGEMRLAPLRLADCEGASVETGVVSACFLNGLDERTCRTLKAGDVFNGKNIGAHVGAGTGSFKATLVNWLKGDTHVRIGASRKTEKLEGFPYENILLHDGDLVINLLAPKAKALRTLQLKMESNGAEIISVKAIDNKFVVPVSILVRGDTYSWEARSGDTAYIGVFSLASVEQAKQLQAAVLTLTLDKKLDETGRHILKYELFYESGFIFDAAGIVNTPSAVVLNMPEAGK